MLCLTSNCHADVDLGELLGRVICGRAARVGTPAGDAGALHSACLTIYYMGKSVTNYKLKGKGLLLGSGGDVLLKHPDSDTQITTSI